MVWFATIQINPTDLGGQLNLKSFGFMTANSRMAKGMALSD
jgi:hypothetical protein